MLSFEDRSAHFIDVFRRSAIEAGYDLLLGPPPADDAAFDRFRSLYRHRSINPQAFELACFRRYFAAQALTALDERVIMADSDLIVGAGFDRLPRAVREFDHGLVGSIGVTDGMAEIDISPHFSVWTGRLLREFCAFLIEIYRDGQDRLDAIHAARAAVAARVAISDMTLLHLWVGDNGIALFDSNRVFDGIHIDHNISLTQSADRQFRPTFGRKSIRRSRGGLVFLTDDGQAVDAAVVHLQGRYKLGALALAQGDMLRFQAVSAYIAAGRLVRRLSAR